jgi:3-hydroxyisobutyrate dehydrogenase-like beta-hydroxyacid dehydrogenase
MEDNIAFIGFGEAAQAFAVGRSSRAFDIKTNSPAARDGKLADYARAGVTGCKTAGDALAGAQAVLSLVTADQALAAARLYASAIAPGTFWFDMNSVAPDTKRLASTAIDAAGGRYVDVAVLAPVHPQRLSVPLLLSGPHADTGAALLATMGFDNVRAVSGDVGAASAIKMIRSVMIKGLEALTTECVLAAEAAGVRNEVFCSLDASWPGTAWAEKADYNLDRMMVHGLRRAAEMEEAVKTLDALGTGSAMTRGTVERQREIGALGLTPASALDDKLDTLLGRSKDSFEKDRAA